MIFGSLSYFYIAKDALENDVAYGHQSLYHAMDTTNIFLKAMDKYITQFAFDNEINRDFNPQHLQSDYNKVKLLGKLFNWSKINGNIISISLSDLKSTVFSSDHGYNKLEQYYDAGWLEELDNTKVYMTDWKRRMVLRTSWEKENSQYLQLLSKGVRLQNRRGYFSIHLDISFLESILMSFFRSPSSILDSQKFFGNIGPNIHRILKCHYALSDIP